MCNFGGPRAANLSSSGSLRLMLYCVSSGYQSHFPNIPSWKQRRRDMDIRREHILVTRYYGNDWLLWFFNDSFEQHLQFRDVYVRSVYIWYISRIHRVQCQLPVDRQRFELHLFCLYFCHVNLLLREWCPSAHNRLALGKMRTIGQWCKLGGQNCGVEMSIETIFDSLRPLTLQNEVFNLGALKLPLKFWLIGRMADGGKHCVEKRYWKTFDFRLAQLLTALLCRISIPCNAYNFPIELTQKNASIGR